MFAVHNLNLLQSVHTKSLVRWMIKERRENRWIYLREHKMYIMYEYYYTVPTC